MASINFAIMFYLGLVSYLSCYIFVNGAELEPSVQECPEQVSVGSSPKTYPCSGKPEYTIGTTAVAGASGTIRHRSGRFNVAYLDQNLVLNQVSNCPFRLTKNVTCDTLNFAIGSRAGGGKGSVVKIGGKRADGMVEWECVSATSTGNLPLRYYFLVNFNGEEEVATASISALRSAFDNEQNSAITSFDPMVFQKFAEVDKDTEIYFIKTASDIRTIFKSEETTIKFKSNQYETLTGKAENSDFTRAARPVCDNVLRLCYEDGCKNGGAVISNSKGLLMLIPFVLVLLK